MRRSRWKSFACRRISRWRCRRRSPRAARTFAPPPRCCIARAPTSASPPPALYPQFSFSGNASSTRSSLADIANGINIWSIGLNLAQPLLRGPELTARKRAAIATYDAANAAYRDSVLHGLQEVADAIRGLEADARTQDARAAAAAAAERAWSITRQRYDLGGVSELALLDAERTRLEATLAERDATAARFADTAALVNALGGSYWEAAP